MSATETKSGKSGSRGEPEKTRAAILNAALEEFAHEGVAGARTDRIARNAGVNKALLYYYFKDKNSLYAAALKHVLAGLTRKVVAVLDRADLGPREKLLLFVATQYDYMGASPLFPRLLQREFMRAGRGPTPPISRVVERYARPIYDKLTRLIIEGCRAGEFRPCDPLQTVTSMLGVIAFYFISITAQQLMTSGHQFSPERIAARRAAVLDFISAAVLRQGKNEEVRSRKPEVGRKAKRQKQVVST